MSSPHHVDDQDREPSGSARGRLIGVGVALAIAVALVLVTGLAWPGWFSGDNQQQPANAAATANPSGTASSPAPAGPPSAPSPAKPEPAPGAPQQGDQGGQQRGGAQPGNPGEPATQAARAAAQAYATAVNTKNFPKMVGMVCDLTKVEKYTYLRLFQKKFSGGKAKVTLYGPTVTQGKWAQTRAKSVVEKNGERGARAITITMQHNENKWCIPSRG